MLRQKLDVASASPVGDVSSRVNQASQRAAFKAFYQLHVRSVGLFLRSLGVRDAHQIEDLLQETFVEAYRAFGTLRDPGAARGWLRTIARRTFGRHLAAQTKLKACVSTLERDGACEPIAEAIEDPRTADGENHYADAQLARRVVACIDMIGDPKQRAAVAMFYVADAPLSEIATELSVRISTLTTWMARFRARVRAGGDR